MLCCCFVRRRGRGEGRLISGNTLANTSLPVFLDSVIGGGWIAILGATGLEVSHRWNKLTTACVRRVSRLLGNADYPQSYSTR